MASEVDRAVTAVDRERLLSHLQSADERRAGARVLDLVEQALRYDKAVATDFLDPHERQVVVSVLGSIPEVSFRAYGGYPKAERQRLLIFPEYESGEELEEPVAALEIAVRSGPGEVGHRDCLGALLGTGIDRAKVGDILVTPRGFQAVVALEVADFLAGQLTRVGRADAAVQRIDLDQLDVEPERVKEVRTTVASLRLDAVAAAGYGVSRTRMAREIKAERVKLNWRPVRDPAREVGPGDVVSIRGRGRVVVEAVEGTTRKGRISVVLKRYM